MSSSVGAECPTGARKEILPSIGSVGYVGSLAPTMCQGAHQPTPKANKLIIINLNVEGYSKPLRALVDTGATNCFVNSNLVKSERNRNVTCPRLKVRLANGSILHLNDCKINLSYSYNSIRDNEDFVPFKMDNKFDIILGLPWLIKHQPRFDWNSQSIIFDDLKGTKVNKQTGKICLGKKDSYPKIPERNRNENFHYSSNKITKDCNLNKTSDQGFKYETVQVSVCDGVGIATQPMKLASPPSDVTELVQLPVMSVESLIADVLQGEVEQICMITDGDQVLSPALKKDTRGESRVKVPQVGEQTKLERYTSRDWDSLKSSPFYELLLEFKDVFREEIPSELPKDKGIRHEIDLVPGSKYCVTRQWPLPKDQVKFIDEFFAAREAAGQVRESKSPHSSPTFCVKKATGGWRVVHAYNKLNDATIPAQTPIPRKDMLLDSMQGSTIFSTIDLRDGYYQILMQEADVPLTAVSTPSGMLWEWLVMPQGLKNAPATFNRCVTHLFRSCREFAPTYFDDIFIHSKASNGKNEIDVHREHLRKVLEIMSKNKFYANIKKCTFGAPEIPILGCFVGKNGVRPDPEKVKAIQDWPKPTNVKELRQFLGLANYLHKFAKNYANTIHPLTQLLRKDIVWEWSQTCETAFNAVKNSLMNSPVLILPDHEKPFYVVCDASDFAIGSALMQLDSEGRERVVAYQSRQLRSAERNYPVHDKELLAMKFALEKFRVYLLSSKPFVIYTDHASLRTAVKTPHLSQRMARWLSFFAEYNFEVKYKPGKMNIVADALSRRPDYESSNSVREVQAHQVMRIQSSLLGEIKNKYKFDNDCKLLLDYFNNPDRENSSRLSSRLISKISRYSMKNGILYYTVDQFDQPRVVVPHDKELRNQILYEYHDSPVSGHMGRERTYLNISRDFYWNHLYKHVRKYIQTCEICQRYKSSGSGKAPLQPLPIPRNCWESMSMDFVFGFPKDQQGNTGIVVFVDRFSKMVHLAAVPQTVSGIQTARIFLDRVFRLHGLPEDIISDRDPRFTSKFWKEVFQRLGTTLKMSTADHPETDGQSERSIRTISQILKSYAFAFPSRWSSHLPFVEFAFNNSVNVSTGHSPFFLNYLRNPRVPSALGNPAPIGADKNIPSKLMGSTKNVENLVQNGRSLLAITTLEDSYNKPRYDSRFRQNRTRVGSSEEILSDLDKNNNDFIFQNFEKDIGEVLNFPKQESKYSCNYKKDINSSMKNDYGVITPLQSDSNQTYLHVSQLTHDNTVEYLYSIIVDDATVASCNLFSGEISPLNNVGINSITNNVIEIGDDYHLIDDTYNNVSKDDSGNDQMNVMYRLSEDNQSPFYDHVIVIKDANKASKENSKVRDISISRKIDQNDQSNVDSKWNPIIKDKDTIVSNVIDHKHDQTILDSHLNLSKIHEDTIVSHTIDQHCDQNPMNSNLNSQLVDGDTIVSHQSDQMVDHMNIDSNMNLEGEIKDTIVSFPDDENKHHLKIDSNRNRSIINKDTDVSYKFDHCVDHKVNDSNKNQNIYNKSDQIHDHVGVDSNKNLKTEFKDTTVSYNGDQLSDHLNIDSNKNQISKYKDTIVSLNDDEYKIHHEIDRDVITSQSDDHNNDHSKYMNEDVIASSKMNHNYDSNSKRNNDSMMNHKYLNLDTMVSMDNDEHEVHHERVRDVMTSRSNDHNNDHNKNKKKDENSSHINDPNQDQKKRMNKDVITSLKLDHNSDHKDNKIKNIKIARTNLQRNKVSLSDTMEVNEISFNKNNDSPISESTRVHMVHSEYAKVDPSPKDPKSIENFVLLREAILRFVRDKIATSQDLQKFNTNKIGRSNKNIFKLGQSVLLSTINLPKHCLGNIGANKLAPKYIGPFKVLHKQGESYTLDIPTRMRLHPTFYVGRLKPYYQTPSSLEGQLVLGDKDLSPLKSSNETSSLGAPSSSYIDRYQHDQVGTKGPDNQNDYSEPSQEGIGAFGHKFVRRNVPPPVHSSSGEIHYHVEKLLDHKQLHNQRHFLVKWLGYPLGASSWEPRSNLIRDIPDLVLGYEKNHNLY